MTPSTQEQQNVLTDAERTAGFRLLFDGVTTAGWRGYNQPEMHPQWRVDNGELRLHPGPEPKYGHDIISVESFTNFELLIDWVLYERGNSGIMYHVQETEKFPFMTGPEIQLLDDDRHPDAQNALDRRTGACYALYAPLADARSPIGQWNRIKLLVDGNRVEHQLNGVLVCQYELGSDDWNARVKASKFVEWPSFAQKRGGHIVLQDHLDPVAFRNIKIRSW